MNFSFSWDKLKLLNFHQSKRRTIMSNKVLSRTLPIILLLAIMLEGQTAIAANRRAKNQRARINQGVKSGELTQQEANRLRAEQGIIRRNKRRANADGTITEEEAAKIKKLQNKASKDIYRQKHDAQKTTNEEAAE